MKTVTVSKVRARLVEYLQESHGSPVVVMQRGKPLAVIIGVNNVKEAESVATKRPRRLSDILDAAEARIDAGQGLSHEEFWRRVAARRKNDKAKKAQRR